MTDTTNVRNKLAKRATGAVTHAEKPKGPPPVQVVVRRAIDRQAEAFDAVLPSGVDPSRFARLVLTAVKATPDLMQCFGTKQGETSVLLAAMQAAAIGLEPNTPTQECWLLPRKNKGTWEAQLSIGYRGLLKLARRSGQIKTIYAEAVHERDHFEWSRGLEEDQLEHRVYDGLDGPGELTHAYAVVRFVGGGYNFVVLNRRAVEARREMSDSWKYPNARPYSPWTRWPESMWRKSAIRELSKYIDLSPEMATALASDEATLRYDPSIESIDASYNDLPLGITSGDEDTIDQHNEPDDEAENDPEQTPYQAPDNDDEDGWDEEPPAELVDDSPDDVETGEQMTPAQSKALHALLRQKFDGASGPARFPILSASLGREITSTKQITVAEASTLIDAYQDMGDDTFDGES